MVAEDDRPAADPDCPVKGDNHNFENLDNPDCICIVSWMDELVAGVQQNGLDCSGRPLKLTE